MEKDVKKVHKRILDLMRDGNPHKIEDAFMMATHDVDKTVFYDDDCVYIRNQLFQSITSNAQMCGNLLKAYLIVEGALRPGLTRVYTCRIRSRKCCGEGKKRSLEFYRFSRVILEGRKAKYEKEGKLYGGSKAYGGSKEGI